MPRTCSFAVAARSPARVVALLALALGCHATVAPAPLAPREGQVAVEPGVLLHYEIHGTGGDTLLVLHGGPASMRRVSQLFRAMDTATAPVAVCRQLFSRELAYRLYFPDSTTPDRLRGDFCARPPDALRAWTTVVRGVFHGLGNWDLRPLLSRVRVPVLILRGTESSMSRASMAEWQRGFPNARLVEFPGAGHYLYLESPDRFTEVVNAFLHDGAP